MGRKMNFFFNAYKKFSVDTVTHDYLARHLDDFIQLDQAGVEKLQKCLMAMLTDVDRMCRQNGIDYSLIGGNVLGKVRHNGFIPWDDDVDLVMMREDYEKFKVKFYESDLTKDYLLRAPDCREGADFRCMKIYKKNSVMELAFHKQNVQHKIFIDVMPVDYVPDSKLLRRWKDFQCSFYTAVLGCIDFKKNFCPELKAELKKTALGSLNYYLRAGLGTVFGVIPLQTWYTWYDRAPRYSKKTGHLTIYNGKLMYMGEIVPTDYFYPFQDCEYCGLVSRTVNRPEDYLAVRYGDYMKVPEPKDRETHIVKRIETGDD